MILRDAPVIRRLWRCFRIARGVDLLSILPFFFEFFLELDLRRGEPPARHLVSQRVGVERCTRQMVVGQEVGCHQFEVSAASPDAFLSLIAYLTTRLCKLASEVLSENLP